MLNVNQMRKSLLKAALEGKLTNSDLESWKWLRLGELVTNNVTFFDGDWILTQDIDNNGSIRLLQLQDIGQGKFLDKSSKYVNEETFTRLKCKELHEGDLMISRMADPIARSCILPKLPYKVITAVDVAVVRCDENIVNNKYLNYVFNSPYMIETASKMARGTTRLRITRRSLGEILIPLPPLSEQALIVSKLDALFDCLDKLDAAQKKFLHDKEIFRKSILKAAFEEAGTLGEWVKLGDVGEYKKGPFGSSLTKSIFVSDSSEAVKVYEQKNAIRKNHEIGKYFITRQYYESKMKGFTVKPGDIIVSCAGTIGETYLLPDEAREGIINQALMRIRLNDNVNKAYFLYCFEAVVMAKAKGKGSAIKNIPPFAIFKNILIPLPPLEEQRRIVKRLDELMSVIDSLSDTESTKHVI